MTTEASCQLLLPQLFRFVQANDQLFCSEHDAVHPVHGVMSCTEPQKGQKYLQVVSVLTYLDLVPDRIRNRSLCSPQSHSASLARCKPLAPGGMLDKHAVPNNLPKLQK